MYNAQDLNELDFELTFSPDELNKVNELMAKESFCNKDGMN